MAAIRVINLRVPTVIGTYDWEQQGEQDLYVDIEVEADIVEAAREDDLFKAVDYEAISKQALSLGKEQSFKLVETYAQRLHDQIREDDRIAACRVKVRKPCAIPGADHIEIDVSSS